MNQEELDMAGANLTAQRDEFATEEAKLAAELATANEELEVQRTVLAAEMKRLAQEQEDLARQRETLAAEREEIAALRAQMASVPVADSTVSTAPDRAAAEEAISEHGAGEGDMVESPPAVSTAADPEVPASPSGDDDVFARLRALSLLREPAEASAIDNAPSPALEAERPLPQHLMETHPVEQRPTSPAPALHTGSGHHDEEESIDDYMAQLFARLNGARSATAPAPPAAKPAPASSSPPPCGNDSEKSEKDVRTAPAAAPVEVAPQLPPLESLALPRRAAPERQLDLSAMRELANMSASSAIGTSQRKQWTSTAAVKLGAAGALGVVGASMLLVARLNWLGHSNAALFGFGGVLFTAGILWLVQGLSLLLMAWGFHKPAANAPVNQPQGASPRSSAATVERAAADDTKRTGR